MVDLRVDNKRYKKLVSRLVAETWIDSKADNHDQLDIDHKDGDKNNNCPSNLEYVTRSENIYRYYHMQGKYKGQSDKQRLISIERGNYYRKLWSHPVNCYTLDDVFIRQFDSISLAEIEIGPLHRKTGAIQRVISGQNQTAFGYKWKLAE